MPALPNEVMLLIAEQYTESLVFEAANLTEPEVKYIVQEGLPIMEATASELKTPQTFRSLRRFISAIPLLEAHVHSVLRGLFIRVRVDQARPISRSWGNAREIVFIEIIWNHYYLLQYLMRGLDIPLKVVARTTERDY